MQKLKAIWFIATGLPLLTSCAVTINDAQFCSPIPGGLGAVCDNMLTSNQLILTSDEWNALQAKWQSNGQAVECSTSQTLGDFKSELEKLCSRTACTYEVKQAIQVLKKISRLGARP